MEKQLRRNVLFNTAGSLIFYFCQAAMNLLVTALAGVEANGLLATAMTIANVALSAASFGMRTFQVSDLSGKYTDRTYLFSRYLTVAAAWVGCMGFAFANAYSAQQRWVIFLYTGYRLVESFSDVWHGYLQKAERMDIVGVSFGVRGLVTAATVVAGLLLTRDLVITLAVLLALNAAYVLAVDLPLARKRADLAAKGGAGVGALLLECLPLAVYASLNTAIPSVPRYYCERLLGRVELNYFANVFLPVLVLQVAVVYLFVPFITTFARLWQGRQKAGYFKGLRILFAGLFLLWAAGAAGVALLGRWGLSVLYPTTPEILNYAGLLQPLVAATVLTVAATVLCNLLTIARAMKGLIVGCLAGLGAALLASPGLIGAYAAWGTAYATILGVGVQALCLLACLLLRCKKQFAAV
ncbi:lipopolysaccharide biosynthesis protein [Allofournierella sp.]|uniref:lipopolysaccharide biosynthesis protein n=1 Tax=Allofournierella sp. TaxID=1940256 RepID=UPI003AB74BA2